MSARIVALVLLVAASPPWSARADTPQAATPERSRVIAAAREVIQKARYCTMVTIGRDGHPQARMVDPFPPEEELTVWIATNPLTRKVREVGKDRRVTLLYFDPAARAYVTLLGRAELVRDRGEKAKRWKEEWTGFYKDDNRGDDYLLIRVRPLRLEVVSEAHGLTNDPKTWQPVIVEWRAVP